MSGDMTREELQKRIGSCFGFMDNRFGSHQLDRDRAKKLRAEVRSSGLDVDDVVAAARAHLEAKGAKSFDVGEQIAKVRDYFS